MNTHKIVETIIKGVAEYYNIHWKMLLPKNMTRQRLYPHARAILSYMLDYHFGRHFAAELLSMPVGTVSTQKTKSREIIAFDRPLQEYITELNLKVNKVR